MRLCAESKQNLRVGQAHACGRCLHSLCLALGFDSIELAEHPKHPANDRLHSWRKATIGSTRVARRAGM